jgi:hypothetical protein
MRYKMSMRQTVIEHICYSTKPFTCRQIVNEYDFPYEDIKNYLRELEKEGFVRFLGIDQFDQLRKVYIYNKHYVKIEKPVGRKPRKRVRGKGKVKKGKSILMSLEITGEPKLRKSKRKPLEAHDKPKKNIVKKDGLGPIDKPTKHKTHDEKTAEVTVKQKTIRPTKLKPKKDTLEYIELQYKKQLKKIGIDTMQE